MRRVAGLGADHKISTSVSENTYRLLERLAAERETSRAGIVRSIMERYAVSYEIPEKAMDPGDEHLSLVAKTRHGKTFLVKNYLVPKLSVGRKVVVLDQHMEYGGRGWEIMPFNYDRTVPPSTNELFETIQLQGLAADVDRVVGEIIAKLAASKSRLISIRMNVLDPEADKMLTGELLKRITARKWNPPLLLIVEEANKYSCQALVSRGRHYGIQAVLLSPYPVDAETASNTRTVVGAVNPVLSRAIDPELGFALLQLERGEFLWEYEKGRWARFKFTAKKR